MVEAAYVAIALVGLLHGLEPSHGWPMAMLYATRSTKPILKGFLSSWIISLFHLISSLAVIVPFILLNTYAGFTLPYVNYIAGFALILISVKLFLEKPEDELTHQHDHIHDDFVGQHGHEHQHPDGSKHTHKHRHTKAFVTLSGIAVFALILGFAHEEEFVLLSLAVGGVNPLLLMLSYAVAVMVSLIGVTLTATKIYKAFEPKFKRYGHLVPKISGLVLLIMGIGFLIGLR